MNITSICLPENCLLIYTGIKLFSTLPAGIKNVDHVIKVFKPALKDFLIYHAFYSVDEFTSVESY
jgi:hypothetical protein